MNLALSKPMAELNMETVAASFTPRYEKSAMAEARMGNIIDGMRFVCSFLLVSMYNENDKLNGREFSKYYRAVEKSLNHRVNEYFEAIHNDPNCAGDLIMTYLHHDNVIRQRLGLQERDSHGNLPMEADG